MEEEKIEEVKNDVNVEDQKNQVSEEKDKKCNIAMGLILFIVVMFVAFVIAWALGCISIGK